MNPTKRPKGMIVIMIFFLWYILKSISGFLASEEVTYTILAKTALVVYWVYFGFDIISIVLAAALVFTIWKRNALAMKLAGSFAVLSVLAGIWQVFVLAQNMDTVKEFAMAQAMMKGRDAQAAQEIANFMTPATIGFSTLAIVAVIFAACFYIYRKREYFKLASENIEVQSVKI
jgi:hypothetical protein